MRYIYGTILLMFCGCQQPAHIKQPDPTIKSRILVSAPKKAQKVEIGNMVTIHYSCWLADDRGKPTKPLNEHTRPLSFIVGAQEVIAGLDQGVQLMRVGEKRRFVIPPHLAYGTVGFDTVIPPQATLIFEVTLLSIP